MRLNSRDSLFDKALLHTYIVHMTSKFMPPLPKAEQDETDELRPKFNADGLIAAIVQDAESGVVLMLAWMNEEALTKTIESRDATYWSRSRQSLWRKGETSGNVQQVLEIRVDCDQDAIILIVNQIGDACHTERKSCFYRSITESGSGLLHLTKTS